MFPIYSGETGELRHQPWCAVDRPCPQGGHAEACARLSCFRKAPQHLRQPGPVAPPGQQALRASGEVSRPTPDGVSSFLSRALGGSSRLGDRSRRGPGVRWGLALPSEVEMVVMVKRPVHRQGSGAGGGLDSQRGPGGAPPAAVSAHLGHQGSVKTCR